MKTISQVAEEDTLCHSNFTFPRRCTQGLPMKSGFLSEADSVLGSAASHEPREGSQPLKIQILISIPLREIPASSPAFQSLFSFLFDPYQEWEVALEKVMPFRVNI